MYKIKEKEIEKYKRYGLVREISQKTDLSESYISQILNGRKSNITKVTAYAIVKSISNNLEIQNLFYIM